MAFDIAKREYSKEHLWYVEIEVNDTTYRFCENRSPIPAGLNANPSLEEVRVNPAEIDLTGGIGVRAKCSISLMESDDYSEWGTISNPERFWARWRAENPYYLGKRISVFSGYIVNNEFDATNFIRRDYIIENFSQRAGSVSITGKDPLKLASDDRSKAPKESRGSLLSDITDVQTTFDLQPTGIGDSEYPASNFYVRIGDEIMLCTSRTGDTLTVTRQQFNTNLSDHSENDVVQLCLYYDGKTVSFIDYDLCVNYGNIDSSYIDQAAWDAESSNSFPTTYDVLITEPTGVQSLLKEFADSAPHYLHWDERVNKIQMDALKPPPEDAPTLTYEANFIEGSTAVSDKQDMRVSTYICNYGIIDPTKDLDETSNYRSTYVREDTGSVTNYGQRAYKTVNSRFISSDNKTAAVLAAARIGRRFSEAPRMLSFSLDAKDSDVWTGDSVRCQSDLIVQQGGGFPFLFYQILTAGESANYNYTALEHTYGPPVDGDEDVEDPNVRIFYQSGILDQLKHPDGGPARTLRDIYEDRHGTGALDPSLDIRFIFESNCVAGSGENTLYAVQTGAWPELTTPILIQNNGLIIGKGGNGTRGAGQNGGPAIQLQADIRLNNINTIGGGGGGGAGETFNSYNAGGGGGAGYFTGLGAVSNGPIGQSFDGQNGTYLLGGAGGSTEESDGGDGGDLGQNGQSTNTDTGGLAGKAIDLNGFAITYINAGDIRGTVI